MSCEDDRITAAPHRPLLADVTVPPPAGSYAIPTPANSARPNGSALPEQETGITIPGGESLYVRVRVTGGILLSDNPDYVAHIGPTGLDGTVIGPRGMNPGECADLCPLEVRVWFYSATEGLGFVFNDMGNNVGERVERVTGPGRFTVLRAGFHAEGTYFEGGTCAPFQNPDLPPNCDPTVVTDVYAFDFSGQQTLSVDFVALALHASSTTPAPGEIVHFQAEGVNVTLGVPAEWWFRPTGAADDIAVPACADHLECDFAPPSYGVMFAQSWVGSGYVGGEVALTPATAAVTIVRAEGPNPAGSFTTKPGEEQVSLEATTIPSTFASEVEWAVTKAPEAAVETQSPIAPRRGATSSFSVPAPSNAAGRWQAYPVGAGLEVKRLGYEVTAGVSSGGTEHPAEPKRVYQDEIDVVRQEYLDLGVWLGPPGRARFTNESPVPHLIGKGFNTGDYGVMVFNGDFVAHLNQLAFASASYGAWQIESQYRNPAHQRFHIPASAKPGLNSWHLYGCAVDITAQGANLQERKRYWSRLEKLAYRLNFDWVEPGEVTDFDHVHVEFHFCQ